MPAALTSVVRVSVAACVATIVGLVAQEHSARADGITAAECVAANEQAGPLRRSGKLRDARVKLRACSVQKCPAIVRKDCVAGAAQADADIPTLAFSVHDPAGNDLSAVKVTVDGQPFADKLDGTAVEVDPGEHLFVFESAGQPRLERRLVVIEGEKNRRERLQMGESAPVPVPVVVPPPVVTPPRPLPPTTSRQRTAGLALGGSGVALLAAGSVFGLFAALRWSSAKQACGPTFPASCQDQSAATSDRSSAVAAGTAADVTLGVGSVAIVTAAVLILAFPSTTPPAPAAARFTIHPDLSPRSGGLVAVGTF